MSGIIICIDDCNYSAEENEYEWNEVKWNEFKIKANDGTKKMVK